MVKKDIEILYDIAKCGANVIEQTLSTKERLYYSDVLNDIEQETRKMLYYNVSTHYTTMMLCTMYYQHLIKINTKGISQDLSHKMRNYLSSVSFCAKELCEIRELCFYRSMTTEHTVHKHFYKKYAARLLNIMKNFAVGDYHDVKNLIKLCNLLRIKINKIEAKL